MSLNVRMLSRSTLRNLILARDKFLFFALKGKNKVAFKIWRSSNSNQIYFRDKSNIVLHIYSIFITFWNL